MKINLHKNARTTPAQRIFIQNEKLMNVSNIALKIGVSETTVRRWKKRSFVFDKPHTPNTITTALTPLQEVITILIRLSLRSGLDDLQQIVGRFILPNCSRSSLNRCLKRYNISKLPLIQKEVPFNLKDHRGTFLYYSKFQFAFLPDQKNHFCIQTLLDHSFRWLHMDISTAPYQPPDYFIKKIINQYPLCVLGIIATDPVLLSDSNTASKKSYQMESKYIQKFCTVNDLKYHPKTQPAQTLYALQKTYRTLQEELHSSMTNTIKLNAIQLIKNISFYNEQLAQRTLKQKTPGQALKDHYVCFPGSFRQHPTQSTGTSS